LSVPEPSKKAKPNKWMDNTCLFLRNLGPDITLKHLVRLFNQNDGYLSAWIFKHKDTQASKECGYVKFSSNDRAKSAGDDFKKLQRYVPKFSIIVAGVDEKVLPKRKEATADVEEATKPLVHPEDDGGWEK
jgi:RNA recognition motif-containing protein